MTAMSRNAAVEVLLSERTYQDGHAPEPHDRARLILAIEHYVHRARTDLMCPQMPAGSEESSIRKVGALALRFIEEHGADLRVRKPGEPRPAEKLHVRPRETLPLLRALLDLYDKNTCIHEDTTRGGSIWTICQGCGRKWADDEGGFQPHVDPPEVQAARALLNGQVPAPPSEADDDLRREAWTDFENACLTDGNDGWVPAPIVRACRVAFDAAWPQGQEAAVRAAMTAFGASGYPAERLAESGESISDDVLMLRQARYVLRGFHRIDPACGYGKLSDACERSADRLQSDEVVELRRTLGDLHAQVKGGRILLITGNGRCDDREVWERVERLVAEGGEG